MTEINFLNTYNFAVISCSFFCSIYLLLKGRTQPLNQRLIGLVLFSVNLYGLTSLAVLGGYILHFPWLFRVFYPIYFIIPPLLFIYVRQGFGEPGFTLRKDFLHLIPAFLIALGLLPLYTASMDEKREWAELIQLNPDYTFYLKSGWIPGTILHLSKDIQALLYGLACLILWRKKVSGMKYELFLSIRKHVIQLSLFFMAYAIISLIIDIRFIASGETAPYIRESNWAVFAEFLIFSLLLSFNLYFFFSDGVHSIGAKSSFSSEGPEKSKKALSKVDFSQEKGVTSENSSNRVLSLELDLSSEEKQIIQRLFYGMETSEWYKRRGFTASDCAELLGIEKHVLSALFKKAILYRFNDFVNHYRVLYIKNAINKGELKTYTLEHIAAEAGFNSRTTFYNAFLKMEGVNPRQYVLETRH